jgi:hypothetical protein
VYGVVVGAVCGAAIGGPSEDENFVPGLKPPSTWLIGTVGVGA